LKGIGKAVAAGPCTTIDGIAIGIEITAMADVHTPAGETMKMNNDGTQRVNRAAVPLSPALSMAAR
jgi:hypothetical protein